ATNMAGRGTDILLGGNPEPLAWAKLRGEYATRLDVPEDIWRRTVQEIRESERMVEEAAKVIEAGGLHVLGSDRHEARRIDRQLMGGAARQGDPGSGQFFLALDDELLEGLGPRRQERLRRRGLNGRLSDHWQRFHALFLLAQGRIERRHYRQRLDLM